MSDVLLDLERSSRIGFDEAIYSAGKTPAQIETILGLAIEAGTPRLFTRLTAEKFAALRPDYSAHLDYDPHSGTAMYGRHGKEDGPIRIAIVLAGTSDTSVGGEIYRTLEYYGHESLQITDVGVAGLWRLLDRLDELRKMDVLIVAAGMEGALPSVVGGLVPGVVIAVPTSVGYGVSEGGRVALNSALASCAPGIVTVNIDNGYGAACAALRIAGVARKHRAVVV